MLAGGVRDSTDSRTFLCYSGPRRPAVVNVENTYVGRIVIMVSKRVVAGAMLAALMVSGGTGVAYADDDVVPETPTVVTDPVDPVDPVVDPGAEPVVTPSAPEGYFMQGGNDGYRVVNAGYTQPQLANTGLHIGDLFPTALAIAGAGSGMVLGARRMVKGI